MTNIGGESLDQNADTCITNLNLSPESPVSTFTVSTFGTPAFVNFVNALYEPDNPSSDTHNISAGKMQENVEWLKTEGGYTGVSILYITWGFYQPLLIQRSCKGWPANTSLAKWMRDMSRARASLALVQNDTPVGYQDFRIPPMASPKNRCDLLDALVQRCFNMPASGQTKPGIPIKVRVTAKSKDSPTRDSHDIRFCWEFGDDEKPVALHLTMVCAYVELSENKDKYD